MTKALTRGGSSGRKGACPRIGGRVDKTKPLRLRERGKNEWMPGDSDFQACSLSFGAQKQIQRE